MHIPTLHAYEQSDQGLHFLSRSIFIRKGTIFFLLEPLQKGGKTLVRVASPENVPILLKWVCWKTSTQVLVQSMTILTEIQYAVLYFEIHEYNPMKYSNCPNFSDKTANANNADPEQSAQIRIYTVKKKKRLEIKALEISGHLLMALADRNLTNLLNQG